MGLEHCDITAIFVSGHHPAGVLMDVNPTRPLQFIGGDGKIFHAHDHDGDDTVVSRLHTDENIKAVFCYYIPQFSHRWTRTRVD